MTAFSFDSQEGLILVLAEVEGPGGKVGLRLALDTGATDTAISALPLRTAGYEPGASPTQVEITTGSGVEHVPVLTVARLSALGQGRTAFPVLAHTLPPSAAVDGVLGLDFLRGHALNIDFRTGQITLT
jgi:predicted aspartyl protease